MIHKLPRALLLIIAIVGAVFFIVSQYLEWHHSNWLSSHPITTNFLASIVAFSTASLVVGVGFNHLTERSYRREAQQRREEALRRLVEHVFYFVRKTAPLLSNPTFIDDPITVGAALRVSEEVLPNLESIKLTPEHGISRIYDLANALYHNGVKPYAEDYLIPRQAFQRQSLRLMEDGLWNGAIYASVRSPESDRKALNNLAGFGELLHDLIKALVKCGDIK